MYKNTDLSFQHLKYINMLSLHEINICHNKKITFVVTFQVYKAIFYKFSKWKS